MIKRIGFWINVAFALLITMHVQAQKIDEERMKRDLEVAENVLQTLIKNEVHQQRGFFGMEIRGSYLPGFGVTFRVPSDLNLPYFISSDDAVVFRGVEDGYGFTISSDGEARTPESEDEGENKAYTLKEKAKQKRKLSADSTRTEYHARVVKAAKDFILDYGDFISQLQPNEKIVVTNRGEQARAWMFNNGKRRMISIEGTKADIAAYKQGKLTREQAISKLKVVNTESVEKKEPDMELISTIFSRLYRSDLSKTYFTDDNIYYEYLKDYGVVYYMQVYSSTPDGDRLNMPTTGDRNLDQNARDKKVTELYPKFEQELKENIIEYARTLKSLKPEELLVFNVTLTKCVGCGIPSTLEVSVKGNVLKDYNQDKLDRAGAVAKINVKKGPAQ